MARRIESLPARRRPGAAPKYPWDQWTDGSAWEIRRGKDFDATPAAMASHLRWRAGRDGLAVRVVVHGETVSFQFEAETKAA